MLSRICVAYDTGREAGWALQLAVELARRTSARLTLAHVAPADEEPVDDRERLRFELIGHSDAVRWHQRLNGMALSLGPDVRADVDVVVGPVAAGLLELVRGRRPDLLLAGSRPGRLRQLGPRLTHTLVAAAPCPVVLVRSRPALVREPVLLECGSAGGRQLAAALGWRLARSRLPAGRLDRRGLLALRSAQRRYRPRLVVIARERCLALRAAAGISRVETLLDTVECPVLVAATECGAVPIDSPFAPRQARFMLPVASSPSGAP